MLLPASTRLGPYESRRGTYRRNHLFFSGLVILFLVSVFIGFARSHYLAGLFKAPRPNVLLHVHGAVFSLWVLLLITQTSLVAAKRVEVHRLGFGLACVMVVLGALVASDQIARQAGWPACGIVEAKAFYAIPRNRPCASGYTQHQTRTNSRSGQAGVYKEMTK